MFPIAHSRPSFALALTLTLVACLAMRSFAQDAPSPDDPNDPPLGDIARNLRQQTLPPQTVIDNDNLSQVMDQAESHETSKSVLKFLMGGSGKGFQISAPDVTCSLSFTASTKALLSDQYAQMDLPAFELVKLTGPATMEGDALLVSLFNGTDWHVSEVDVALTVVKKNDPAVSTESAMTPGEGPSQQIVQIPQSDVSPDAVRPEKKQDQTLIYKMRAAAPPLSATTFSAPLGIELAPGQEWHWAIVQAKGYPPQSRLASTDKSSSADAPIPIPTPPQSSAPRISLNPSPVAFTQPQEPQTK